jgi:hypothetical protein
MKTTLRKIKFGLPNTYILNKLLTHVGKTEVDDEEISFLTILNVLGYQETLWCFRVLEGYDKELRLFSVWCVRKVQHLMRDPVSVKAIDVAERFAHGKASKKELDEAFQAAYRVAVYISDSLHSFPAYAAAYVADKHPNLRACSAVFYSFSDHRVCSSFMYDQENELRRILIEMEAL